MAEELDVEHWNYLEDQWNQANKAACEAQTALDFKLRNYLVSDKQAPGPTLDDQRTVDKLWISEAEQRRKMDDFIRGHFK